MLSSDFVAEHEAALKNEESQSHSLPHMYQHVIQHNLMRKSAPQRGAGMPIIKRASNRADMQYGKKLNRRVDFQSIHTALTPKETEQAQTLAMQRRLPYNLADTVMKIHRFSVAADDPLPLRHNVVSFLSQYISKRPSPMCPAYSSCHDSTGLLSMHPWTTLNNNLLFPDRSRGVHSTLAASNIC